MVRFKHFCTRFKKQCKIETFSQLVSDIFGPTAYPSHETINFLLLLQVSIHILRRSSQTSRMTSHFHSCNITAIYQWTEEAHATTAQQSVQCCAKWQWQHVSYFRTLRAPGYICDQSSAHTIRFGSRHPFWVRRKSRVSYLEMQ